ncbi:MAG: hypothetical protein AAFV98_13480 [Chloroflexota bacterium]
MSNLYQLDQQWNEQIKSLYDWWHAENHEQNTDDNLRYNHKIAR